MDRRNDVVWRFGPFEVDELAPELRRNGTQIRLQDLPHRLLVYLVRRPGAVVSREELRGHLWPDGRFVDFEHGLNTAVKKLRLALADSADEPRFIETIPRRGYRFIAEVKTAAAAPVERRRPRWIGPAFVFSAILACCAVAWDVSKRSTPVRPVAVLPIENLSGDRSQEYFADGITDTLITDLGRLRLFPVISRSSVVHYKRTREPLPQIARELGAGAVVEGSVVTSGGRVRVAVRLIDPASGQNVWSDAYERDATDIIALEDEVARAIARHVKNTLVPRGPVRVPVSPVAEDAYFRGLNAIDTYTRDGIAESAAQFERAVRTDPEYAEAWAALANSYNLLGVFRALPWNEALAKSEAAARTALRLDAQLGAAHTALAEVDLQRWKWTDAETEFRRAMAIDPNDATAHQMLGYLLSGPLGRMDEAIAEMKLARDLDPLSPSKMNALGVCLYRARHYDEAIDVLTQIPDGDENTTRRHRALSAIYEQKRMLAKAEAELIRSVAPVTTAGEQRALSQRCAALSWPDCRTLVLSVDIARTAQQTNAMTIAADFARIGDAGRAFAWIERAIGQHDHGVMYLTTDPEWDSIRGSARYAELVGRLAIAERLPFAGVANR